MMSRLGVNAKEMSEVKEAVLRTETKEIVIQNPTVTSLEIQGQLIFQIVADSIEEREIQKEEKIVSEAKPQEIPEEDILLVAQQANVSFEEAKKALEETNGDLAQAILMLTSRKG
ncbi:MAG: hypothetical protein DRO36_04495 [Candidatus Hecatellales archaeon]|nr:MAG: hypothetical protein DRO36_04495 [Candidatus Hecatellales archaeon]